MFDDAATKRFDRRMEASLHQHWPAECAAMGQERLATLVRLGKERAATHGILTQRGVFRYLNLMMLLGPEFDRNSSLPWAGEILGNPEKSEQQKLDALTAHARQATGSVPLRSTVGAH